MPLPFFHPLLYTQRITQLVVADGVGDLIAAPSAQSVPSLVKKKISKKTHFAQASAGFDFAFQ